MAEASRTIGPLVAAEARAPRRSEGYWGGAVRRLLRDRFSLAALIVFVLIVGMTVGASLITDNVLRQDPNRGRLTQQFQPPSATHPFGTDELGRDQLARLLHAGRVSLAVGVLSMLVSLTIGVSLGLLAAYYGGWVDDVINAAIQLISNIPSLFLLIMLSVILRPSVIGLSLLIGLLGWTGETRLIRARVLSERRRDYVDAAVVAGSRPLRVMFRHILPNVASLVLLSAGGGMIGAILGEAGISYLGFGVRIPTASWGNMLSGSLNYFTNAPWLVVAPGAMVTLTILCLFQLTDGLRDALDPRFQS